MSVTHYAVTTSYWRGIFRWEEVARQHRLLRRACDWNSVGVDFFDKEPTCGDCVAYRDALLRMGVIR